MSATSHPSIIRPFFPLKKQYANNQSVGLHFKHLHKRPKLLFSSATFVVYHLRPNPKLFQQGFLKKSNILGAFGRLGYLLIGSKHQGKNPSDLCDPTQKRKRVTVRRTSAVTQHYL